MARLKQFLIWIILIVAFALYSNALIYLMFHGDEIGMKIYNMTHKEVVQNEVQSTEK